jgi:hypothetical protein
MEKEKGFSRKQYDNICKRAKELGITIVSKYHKGMKTIKVGDIILAESKEEDYE